MYFIDTNTIKCHCSKDRFSHAHKLIYRMADPRTNEYRYVGTTGGVTEDDLQSRLKTHIANRIVKKTYNHPKNQWLRELYDLGLKPIIELAIDAGHISESAADMLEAKVALELIEQGNRLTNRYLSGICRQGYPGLETYQK